MPRIQPLNKDNATGPAKELLGAVEGKLGRVPNLLGTMAHAPAVLKSYLDFSGNLGQSSLSPAVREQIALAVSNANGCGYCVSAHTAMGKAAGLTEAQAKAAQRGEADDDKTRAILTLSLQLVEKRGWLTDGDIAQAKTSGVSEAELLEVVAVVVYNTMTNYFNHVIETEVDFPKVELIETASA